MIGDHPGKGHPVRVDLAHQASRVSAGHVVHRDPKQALVFAAVMNSDNVRMRQPGRQVGLAQEPCPKLWIASRIRR